MIKKPITNDSGELSELQSGDGLGSDYVAINPSAGHTPLQGEIAYNTDEGTLDIGLDNSIIHTGQEVLYRVINKTASTITKGSLVMYDGTVGASGKLKVKPWVGGSDPLLIMGVANADIPAEGGLETGLGYVTAFGKVRGIDTTGSPYSESWANGDLIYAGTTSGLTKTKPSAPNTKTIIAAVVNSHASTGELMVRVTLSSSIENDDKVQISSITDKDLLQWNNSTLRFENKSFTAAGFGTIATQNANSVAITGGAIDGTTIGGSTPAAGTFTTLTATGTSYFGGSATSRTVQVDSVAGGTTPYTLLSRDSINNIQLVGGVGTTNLGLYTTGGGTIRFYTTTGLNEEQLRISRTASAVNYVQVTGAAQGNPGNVIISSQGSDSNVSLNYQAKGNSQHIFATRGTTTQFRVGDTLSAVNFINVTGSIAGNVLPLSAAGNDSNIPILFQSKGTGAIDLAPGSSGVNISNGGTVTALTRTVVGTGYTSSPTVTISAPTTAGGVQATATTNIQVISIAIVSGGTGYTVGDILTVAGGTNTTAATVSVVTVSGGVITSVSSPNNGTYTVAPTNPVSVTGGTGSGATFNLTFGVGSGSGTGSIFTITNAGSGYVEQPTVTFSGGGGSGAAAYATVGSGTTVKSIGSTMSFNTPGGEPFRIIDGNASASTYWSVIGSSAPYLRAAGGNSSIIENVGAVPILFRTNNGVEQFRVAHTASAVNYVQVTGAVTTVNPVISAQGSDTNINLALQAKGNSAIIFRGGNGGTVLLVNGTTSTGRNYLTTTSSASGSAPIFGCDGGDTNIDLALTPKGTGVVKELVGSTYYNVLSQYDVGTAADQVPLNQYLGANAYVDSEFQALDVGTGISTGTGTICKAHAAKQDGLYTIRIIIDLTGLNSGGTANDIIGVNGTALPCYIARLPNQVIVLGGRMTCLETPAGGDTDIDLYSATEGTGVEDADVTTLTETLLINAGTQSVGTVTYFSADPGVNQYLYLAGQSTSNATYTAGRFLIEIFGVQ